LREALSKIFERRLITTFEIASIETQIMLFPKHLSIGHLRSRALTTSSEMPGRLKKEGKKKQRKERTGRRT